MLRKMKVKVFAKLNLTLNVYEAANDFHRLESVVCSTDIFDTVSVTLRTDGIIGVSGVNDVALTDNTAYRAAVAVCNRFYSGGVDIDIQKGIPFGGGLGGSSADAAAVLYCLQRLLDVDECTIKQIAAEVGSDVYYMMHGGFAVMRGKGEQLTFFDVPELWLVVVEFAHQSSTRQVFAKYDALSDKHFADTDAVVRRLQVDTAHAAELFVNGLQAAAEELSDYAADFLAYAHGCGYSPVMTGSGSAYFLAFDNKQAAEFACSILHEGGFAVRVAKTVKQGIMVID